MFYKGFVGSEHLNTAVHIYLRAVMLYNTFVSPLLSVCIRLSVRLSVCLDDGVYIKNHMQIELVLLIHWPVSNHF